MKKNNSETIKETKIIGLMGSGSMRELSEEEIRKRKNVNKINTRNMEYEINGEKFYNIAEVDTGLAVNRYLNSVGIQKLTTWQKVVQWGIIGLVVFSLFIFVRDGKIRGEVKELKTNIMQTSTDIEKRMGEQTKKIAESLLKNEDSITIGIGEKIDEIKSKIDTIGEKEEGEKEQKQEIKEKKKEKIKKKDKKIFLDDNR